MSTVRKHLLFCVVQIMKLRRNIFAFARELHDSLDYIIDLKETENRSKKAMQKKIAIMLILMMMAGLDAHGARDLHPGLRKNSS